MASQISSSHSSDSMHLCQSQPASHLCKGKDTKWQDRDRRWQARPAHVDATRTPQLNQPMFWTCSACLDRLVTWYGHACDQKAHQITTVCLQDHSQHFDTKQEYVYQDEVYGLEGRPYNPLAQNQLPIDPDQTPSTSGRGEDPEEGRVHHGPQWGLLTLTQPVTASEVSHQC